MICPKCNEIADHLYTSRWGDEHFRCPYHGEFHFNSMTPKNIYFIHKNLEMRKDESMS